MTILLRSKLVDKISSRSTTRSTGWKKSPALNLPNFNFTLIIIYYYYFVFQAFFWCPFYDNKFNQVRLQKLREGLDIDLEYWYCCHRNFTTKPSRGLKTLTSNIDVAVTGVSLRGDLEHCFCHGYHFYLKNFQKVWTLILHILLHKLGEDWAMFFQGHNIYSEISRRFGNWSSI